MTAAPEAQPLLVAEHLVKTFPVRRTIVEVATAKPHRRVIAIDDVSFVLYPGQVLGIVGESGSGKSTIAYSLVRLLRLDKGRVLIGTEDIHSLQGTALRHCRQQIQLIFQDPYSSLNPRLTVGRTVAEPARVHGLVDRAGEHALAQELLERCGLRRQDAARYPRELSGGQRQRVAIARALATKPRALVADEAVSALDVSVQAQILTLFGDLRAELGLGIVFITHQLAVISQIATDVAVVYLGRVLEAGPADAVLGASRHPYTRSLLAAQPTLRGERVNRQPLLHGEVPSSISLPSGCRFHTRCPLVQPICREVDPPAVEVAPGHFSRCHVLAAG